METYDYKTGTFIGNGSIEIFFRHWAAPEQKGIVVILHGHGEHSGRYNNLIAEFEGKNISVYIMDHRGHGRSGGNRGHINSFMDYINDLRFFINIIRKNNKEMPLILLGHSLGGLIAIKYALVYPDGLSGLILSSPLLLLSMDVPRWKEKLGNIMSKYIPSLTLSSELDSSYISHDDNVVDAYENDPVVHDRASSRFFTELTETREHCMRMATEIKLPVLIFHGSDDKIVDYRGSEQFYKRLSSKEKDLHIFEGLYHETMNETEKEKNKVLKIVYNWIRKTVKPKKSSTKKKSIPKKAKEIKVKRKTKSSSSVKTKLKGTAKKKKGTVRIKNKGKKK